MNLIDTHCHLSFAPLWERIESVLTRAFLVGVDRVLVPAYDGQSWERMKELSKFERVYPALGIHPWVREKVDPGRLKDAALGMGAVAIGEIGLDTRVEGLDWAFQMENFRRQLEVAMELNLPVMLHCRGAFEEMLEVLGGYAPGLRGVVHAFSRGPDLMERFLGLGLYVAFGGAVTRPTATRVRNSAKWAPADRILLETDAPSIGLDQVIPEDVEPRHIIDIAVSVAEVRGDRFEDIAEWTTQNARRLFGI